MTPAILASLIALGALGGAAGLAASDASVLGAAPECTDLAGQGSACYEVVIEGGSFEANGTVVIEPSPPVGAQRDCVDLAGSGQVCQEGDASSGSVTYEVRNDTVGFSSSGYVRYS